MLDDTLRKKIKVNEDADYAVRKDFNKDQVAVIDGLVKIQKQINLLNIKLKPLQATQKELRPRIIEILNEIGAAGARVGKILMYLRGKGTYKDPTYKQVLAAAQKTMSKDFVRKLEAISNELQVPGKEELAVKTESIGGKLASVFAKIKSVFSNLNQSLEEIAKAAGEDYEPMDEEPNDKWEPMGDAKGAIYDESVIKEEVETTYLNPKVDLEVYVIDLDSAAGEDIEVAETVAMKFEIQMDHRSWGIKGIECVPKGNVRFHLKITAPDKDEYDATIFEKDLAVDLSDAEVELQPGHAYTPASLEVEVNRKGEVQKVLVTFYYISEQI